MIQQKPIRLTVFSEPISSPVDWSDKETTSKPWANKTDNQAENLRRLRQRLSTRTADYPPEVQAVLDVVKSPRGVQAKPEVFYDNSFVQKIEASGFINSLYAR
jgi:hypothetical protein